MNAVLVVGGRRGPSLRPMAAELTAQGIQTPRGGHWSACAVRMCCCGWRHADRAALLGNAIARLERLTPLDMGPINPGLTHPEFFVALRTFRYPRQPFPARLRPRGVISETRDARYRRVRHYRASARDGRMCERQLRVANGTNSSLPRDRL
jgi:hypothetical protein